MYTLLSQETKDSIMRDFRLRYYIRSGCEKDGADWNTVVSFVRRDAPEKGPIELFKMLVSIDNDASLYRIKNLVESMPERVSALLPMRLFLLDLLITDALTMLGEGMYRSLFIYSPIPHITEVFMDHRFKIRRVVRRKQNNKIHYVGYKTIL